MSPSVTVKFTPGRKDYADVLRLFFWQRLSTKLSLGILVLAFAAVFFVIVTKGSPPSFFELVWLLLPPFFVIFVFFIQPSRLASQAVQKEQLVTEATWDVSDAGVQISSRFGSSHLDWDSLRKLVTTKDYYLLLSKSNQNSFRFLPRRAFSSPQQQEQFLELVRINLSAG